MTDPQNPKYGPVFDPNAGGGDQSPDPDIGKDLGYLVPSLYVGWSSPPSFNQDLPGENPGDEDKNKDVPPCGPIQVNLGTLRTAAQSMLAASRTIVDDYETLRGHVMYGDKDTMFGQNAMVEGQMVNTGTASNPAWQQTDATASPIQEEAKQFADMIVPEQEKMLWQVANTVELVGQYIAAISAAGEAYAHADRQSEFPYGIPGATEGQSGNPAK